MEDESGTHGERDETADQNAITVTTSYTANVGGSNSEHVKAITKTKQDIRRKHKNRKTTYEEGGRREVVD